MILYSSNGKSFTIDDADLDIIKGYTWYSYRGYLKTTISSTDGTRHTLLLHRLLMGNPDSAIDHKNRDPSDNRRCNLRVATPSENSRNISKQKGTSSIYKGVSWQPSRNKWEARIRNKGKKEFLGRFLNELEAAKAYDARLREVDPEFGVFNFSSI